jgi:hypothetical protein
MLRSIPPAALGIRWKPESSDGHLDYRMGPTGEFRRSDFHVLTCRYRNDVSHTMFNRCRDRGPYPSLRGL